jgi:GNAT superfamily N-acetyltransferase
MAQEFRIRSGTIRDVSAIFAMLRGLAKYERLMGKFAATPSTIRRDGFERHHYFRTLLCWRGETLVGLAVYFFTYSTFAACPTLYIEDVFVWPRHRGKGAGEVLMSALARIAVRKGCGRMEWAVLGWNLPAIRFYKRLGANQRREWILSSLTGAPLRRLARTDQTTAAAPIRSTKR